MPELNQNLSKGLEIAELMQQHRQLSLLELINICGYSKQAVLRCLDTYLYRGWLRKRLNDRRYVWLGMPTAPKREAAEVLAGKASATLKALSQLSGCAVDLALLNADQCLYIADSTRTQANSGVNLYVAGYKPSLVMTALGRAYLLSCDALKITDTLADIAHYGDLMERRYLQEQRWKSEMTACAERGYSLRYKEDYIPQILPESNPSLAVAIALITENGPIGAINLVWDDSAVSSAQIIEDHLINLQQAASRISELVLT